MTIAAATARRQADVASASVLRKSSGKFLGRSDASAARRLHQTRTPVGRRKPAARTLDTNAVAAHSTLPVIGVPLSATSLGGMDALLATVQMPAGFPVATVAIGKAGARNAAHLAAQIIATSDAAVAEKIQAFRAKKAQEVEEASAKLAAEQ